jgi:hypothetical protein
LVLAFWLLSSVGSGSDALWAVEVVNDTSKTILDSDGNRLPVFKFVVKPRFTNANQGSNFQLVSCERVSGITSTAVYGGSNTGFYNEPVSVIGGLTTVAYVMYDPSTDTVYRATNPGNSLQGSLFMNMFLNSWAYKSYEIGRNPPSQVLSSEGLGGRILVKLQAYILAGISLGLSLYVLWMGYRAIDHFLYGVHKTYMQKKSARYIKSVMDASGGDPLGGGETTSRSSVDPSLEFPPPR